MASGIGQLHGRGALPKNDFRKPTNCVPVLALVCFATTILGVVFLTLHSLQAEKGSDDVVICFLIIVLIGLYLLEAQNRRAQIERVVETRTADLQAAVSALADVSREREESQQRYRTLVENSPNGLIVEREGKVVLMNRAAAKMLQFDRTEELKNCRILDFVSTKRRLPAEEEIRKLYSADGHMPARETKLLRRDGSSFAVEVAASSFCEGDVRSIQVVFRDISLRKLAEAEKARLILAVEQVEESIVITDEQARIVYVNPAFERISGYRREEVLGQNPRILKSGQQSPEFYAEVWKALTNGESWSGQFVNRAKSGRIFTEEVMISPMVDASGQITNYVAVKRDATLEDELKERLQQSQKMDAIGRLAGGVAHDFNNMLMVITSYTELLACSLPEGDPLGRYTDQILRAAQRSSGLTRQLLTFSRKQVVAPQIIDCNDVVLETSGMIRRLIAENIELKCDLAPELWRMKADANQMVQVIVNLCLNARDAMPGGGVLTLATRNYQLDEGFVELSVSDTGMGIAPELKDRLFEPFFTTKERGKGTGLGLATVYSIVQQSGGRIFVESAAGKGAQFRIHFPRCRDAIAAPQTPVRSRAAACREAVLVVEDEHSLRQAIVDHLRSEGYEVMSALDGVEAMEVLTRHPEISILLTDVVMPRMGGRELMSALRERAPHLRVIFMSGYTDQQESGGGEMGAIALLQKPFTMDRLLGRIAEAGESIPLA